jgi:ribosomal protein L2
VKGVHSGPNGLKVGAKVVSGPDSPPEMGNCLPLANIPTGWKFTISK